MKTTSKGLGTKKVLRCDQIDELEKITENKIDESIDKIIDAEFNINPKRIGMNNLGCKYCQFKDICFFNENNTILKLHRIFYDRSITSFFTNKRTIIRIICVISLLK